MADETKTITVGGQAQEKEPNAPSVVAPSTLPPTSDSNKPAPGITPSTPQPAKNSDASGPAQVPSGAGSSPSKPVQPQDSSIQSSSINKQVGNEPTVSNPSGDTIAKDEEPINFDWQPIYQRFVEALEEYRANPGVDVPENDDGDIEHPRFAQFDHYIQGHGGPLAIADAKEQLKNAAKTIADFLNS